MLNFYKKQRGETHLKRFWWIFLVLCILWVTPQISADTRIVNVSFFNNTVNTIAGVGWEAQSFTTNGSTYLITTASISMHKIGTPTGNVLVIVQANNDSGQPDGTNVSTGKIDVSTLTEYRFHNITMSSATLEPNKNYSVILACPDCAGGNNLEWDRNSTGTVDPIHSRQYSINSGTTWKGDSNTDYLYEIFGTYSVTVANNSVTLNLPKDNVATTQTTANFSANFSTVDGEYVWKNGTYTVWYSNHSVFNETTVDVGDYNFSSLNITGFKLGTYKWNVYGCAENTTGTLCLWATSNFTFPVGANINAQAYENFTYETTNEKFNLNISLIQDATLYASNLYYNGTSHSATITDLGSDKYNIDVGVDVPLVLTGKSNNYTFFWELIYERNDGTFAYQNLTEKSQIANRTWFIYCNSTFDRAYINFTTKEAENPYPMVNGTFKSAWEWSINPTGTVKRNISFEDITENNISWSFCAFPEDKSFTTTSTIEYDGTDRAKNFYYLNDATLTNATTNTSLYLLNDSAATLTVLQVVDGAQQPIPNVYIQIQAYDVGTDTYYTVSNAKTSSQGEDLTYLNWYDTLYKFILIQNGEVVKTTSPYKISETPQTFLVLEEDTYDLKKFQDFVYTLTFNEVTNNFVLTYTKPSGLVDSACLRVTKRSLTNDTQICLTCETSSSATLYCNINGYGNGTYIATFYATGSFKVVDFISQLIGTVNEVYIEIGNLDGTAMALILAGIVMVMFLISPVMGVIGVLLGMVAAMVLGFQPLDYGAFTGICVVGGIVIWLLKR